MKLGVVHFGSFTMGAIEVIRTLIEENHQNLYTLYGIEWNRHTKGIELKELHTESIKQADYKGDSLLMSFPDQYWSNHELEEIAQLDHVIVLGGEEHHQINSTINMIHVPVSIFNEIPESSYSLGYDSALNTVYSSVEKIRDTASSLIYNKLRVFPIQVPGEQFTPLVEDAALAVNAPFVTNDHNEGLTIIKKAIEEKNRRNQSYLFILMDYSVDHKSLEQVITTEFDVDWKVMSISKSQCVGPFPTALDQIYIRKLSTMLLDLINKGLEPGRLVIQNHEVIFKKK
ncbi:6-phosphofructokinase [Bacillus sp. PS06]|uniref:6-phosphofructokinase n=1 Tax=Bacillus sp. PS06 TaxID=2764176 RepID=UPI00177E91DC|nr:6-phosphofructokinase [Bacillus sp. PS06]MBD8071046.1 6-phosphofructokinase [Bacillus sp. PS06]